MRLSRLLFHLCNHIEYYSKFQPTSFTLQSLIDFGLLKKKKKFLFLNFSFIVSDGDIKRSYKFLRVELLIRWSHMHKEMKYLPSK